MRIKATAVLTVEAPVEVNLLDYFEADDLDWLEHPLDTTCLVDEISERLTSDPDLQIPHVDLDAWEFDSLSFNPGPIQRSQLAQAIRDKEALGRLKRAEFVHEEQRHDAERDAQAEHNDGQAELADDSEADAE